MCIVLLQEGEKVVNILEFHSIFQIVINIFCLKGKKRMNLDLFKFDRNSSKINLQIRGNEDSNVYDSCLDTK